MYRQASGEANQWPSLTLFASVSDKTPTAVRCKSPSGLILLYFHTSHSHQQIFETPELIKNPVTEPSCLD